MATGPELYNGDHEPDDTGIPGRGMVELSIDEDGMITMVHTDTKETFRFDREDFDEVIGMLATFRMVVEAGEECEDDEDDDFEDDDEDDEEPLPPN